MKFKGLEDLTLPIITTLIFLFALFIGKAFENIILIDYKPVLLDNKGLYYIIYAALCFTIAVLVICFKVVRSQVFLQWWNRDNYVNAIENGKALLQQERYIEAILAFEKALAYKRTPSALLGEAFALEKMGELDSAIQNYSSAAFLSYQYSKETLADMTDIYVRALMRFNMDSEIALRPCESALYHLKGTQNDSVDNLRVSRGFLLIRLNRGSEAKTQFEQVAETALNEDIKKLAREWAYVADLMDLSKEGMDQFFTMLDIEKKLKSSD